MIHEFSQTETEPCRIYIYYITHTHTHIAYCQLLVECSKRQILITFVLHAKRIIDSICSEWTFCFFRQFRLLVLDKFNSNVSIEDIETNSRHKG